jgi:prepilin signal peptidase PulO-like enzyme (type II secretory pathway)
VVSERSSCPCCKNSIKWFDLIPIISFFVLKGRCRHCQTHISWRYPLSEAVTGFIFVLIALSYGPAFLNNILFFRNIIFCSALIIIFLTDLKDFLIFDAITIPFTVLAVALNLFALSNSRSFYIVILNILLSMAVGLVFFGLQYFFSKGKWLGAGDIKMGVMLGAMLSAPELLLTLFLSYIIGALISLILLALKLKNRKSELPMGVFLSVGALIALLYGEKIISWYLNII